MQIELNSISTNSINNNHNGIDIQTEFDIWIFRWWIGQFTYKIWNFCYPPEMLSNYSFEFKFGEIMY